MYGLFKGTIISSGYKSLHGKTITEKQTGIYNERSGSGLISAEAFISRI
jgi:hypothetical protein